MLDCLLKVISSHQIGIQADCSTSFTVGYLPVDVALLMGSLVRSTGATDPWLPSLGSSFWDDRHLPGSISHVEFDASEFLAFLSKHDTLRNNNTAFITFLLLSSLLSQVVHCWPFFSFLRLLGPTEHPIGGAFAFLAARATLMSSWLRLKPNIPCSPFGQLPLRNHFSPNCPCLFTSPSPF